MDHLISHRKAKEQAKEQAIREKEAKEAAAKEAATSKHHARIAAKQEKPAITQSNDPKTQSSLKIQLEDQLKQQRIAGAQVKLKF